MEVELIAAGLVDRQRDSAGRETLRVTDAGVQVLAGALARNRGAFNAHEALVARVATEMARAGRVVWTRLALRAKVADKWVIAMPDVFSIRHTTVEAYVEPIVHEVKVSRADLLADLRRVHKGAAYCELAGQCWYVLRDGIADAAEVPESYGVMVARDGDVRGASSSAQAPLGNAVLAVDVARASGAQRHRRRRSALARRPGRHRRTMKP